MTGIVKQTYLILLGSDRIMAYKEFKKSLWVIDGDYYHPFGFISIDGKKYNLAIYRTRPPAPRCAIPYELFIEDEIGDV